MASALGAAEFPEPSVLLRAVAGRRASWPLAGRWSQCRILDKPWKTPRVYMVFFHWLKNIAVLLFCPVGFKGILSLLDFFQGA